MIQEFDEFFAPALIVLVIAIVLVGGGIWRRRQAEIARQLEVMRWQKLREQVLALGAVTALDGDARSRAMTLTKEAHADPERLLGDAEFTANLIRIHLMAGEIADGERLLELAGRRHAGDPRWADLAIDLLVSRRASDQKAIERLADACRRRPERADWLRRFLALAVSGGNPTAPTLQILGQFQRQHGDVRALQFLADHFERKKVFNSESLPFIAGMAEHEKDKAKWHYGLARCRHRIGDLDGAKESLQRTLQLDPRHQPALEFRRLLDGHSSGPLTTPPAGGGPGGTAGSVVVAPVAGKLPARYVQVSELGRGGMGMVYKAFDDVLKRQVAIKTLNEDLAQAQPDLRERFLAESRTLAALDHPSIPKVFDVAVEPPSYIAFEFISGDNLRKVLAEGELPLAKVLQLGAELTDGFHHAVTRGVFHRDIKPENILVETTGRARIVDFGLAHGEGQSNLTQTGVVLGTPWYLAPERLRGDAATVASEIFAFGVTFYEMLCGQRPFAGDDMTVVFMQDPRAPRQFRPACPPPLEVLVLDCINKNPNNRPASFAEVGQELRNLARDVHA